MFRSKPPRHAPGSTHPADAPAHVAVDNPRASRMRPPWRRAKSGTDAAPAVPPSPSPAAASSAASAASVPPPPSDIASISEDSFAPAPVATPSSSSAATTFNAPAQPRPGPLKRLSAVFKDPDGRFEENLKSMKRRVVQVRRQPDHAPVRFQMGFRSRTGWEPIRATKENQDCLVALVPWGPSSTYNLFAALDGHGRNGHQCAIFVAQKVVAYLNRMLLQDADKDTIAEIMHRAIAYAERKLESPNVTTDFELSGSTGVFVLAHGATLFCANVGDSRAVIGREKEGRMSRPRRSHGGALLSDKTSKKKNLPGHTSMRPPKYAAIPLSIDQKPSRPDEKQRLLAAGARVDAWEGIDVGEERVWLPEARTPGLAVSRSFGDLLVKRYGVNCTPEVYALDLCQDDRFMVMASDGVFEFMSSTEVVDVVGRWRERGSAQEAAEELVKLATDRWIDDDSVIDDISCVVVFMNVISPDAASPREPILIETSAGSADNCSEVDNCASLRNLNRTGNDDLAHDSMESSAAALAGEEQRGEGHHDDLGGAFFGDDTGPVGNLTSHAGKTDDLEC